MRNSSATLLNMNKQELRQQAAISALQGILEARGGVIGEIVPEIVAKEAVRLADALVSELNKVPKHEEINLDQEPF